MARRHLPGGLTKTAILKAVPKDKVYKLSDGGGLVLYVMPSGHKIWKYRYYAKDLQTGMKVDTCVTLGVHGAKSGCIDIDTAREMAIEARKVRKEGGDPSKRFSKDFVPPQDNLFRSVSEHWIQRELLNGTWSDDTCKALVSRFETYMYPELGDIPITVLGAKEFRILLDSLVDQNKKGVAYKVFSDAKRIFDHAVVEEIIDYNPLDKLKGRFKEPKSSHYKRVDKNDLQGYLIDLDNDFRMKSVTRCALKLIHLTFLRSKELRYAKWVDIDLDKRIWEVPGLTMKNGEEFIVPLSDQAIEVLQELRNDYPNSELVFPGFSKDKSKPLSGAALLKAIKTMGFDATAHGFRQIASTALNENGFNPDAIECQLDHHKHSVRMIYNRAQYLDERADIMQWLADSYDDVKRGGLVL